VEKDWVRPGPRLKSKGIEFEVGNKYLLRQLTGLLIRQSCQESKICLIEYREKKYYEICLIEYMEKKKSKIDQVEDMKI
jgi:hypothetical protein